jgi:hypothetical protein
MSNPQETTSGWRDAILVHFTSEIAAFSPITVVADPDRLLSEQRLLSALNVRGFEVVLFEDPISFRYLYESRFRTRGAEPNATRLVVASTESDQTIPFDIQDSAAHGSRVLSFGLAALFPQLTPSVVAELDRDDLDALFRAQQIHQPGRLGENATRDFILRHVCEVAPELIRSTADLLRVLLRRHYQERQFPLSVDQRFISLVRSSGMFGDWPLESIVSDRNAFMTFFRERWDGFIRAKAGQDPRVEQMTVAGPAGLPFEHPDIKVYVDNLCLEGVLKPVQGVSKQDVGNSWLAVGVMVEAPEGVGERFKKLTAHLTEMIPSSSSVHTEWVTFAYRWAEWNVLRHQVAQDEMVSLAKLTSDAQAAVDTAFEQWLLINYGALGSLSYVPRPVMVHQIAKSMAYGWWPSLTAKKKALIVIDGLALDQWLLVKEFLGTTLQFAEGGAFAWIPTLTAISRQSIFAGESPLYYSSSLGTTSKEELHWCRFWENHGVRRDKIAYIKQKGQEETKDFVSRVNRCTEETDCIILGVVVGVIDDTIHGSTMGSSGLHAQVRHWAKGGQLRSLLEFLVNNDFEVHVTADHGNVEARGIGKPNVGVVAEQRGERAHILPDESIRNSVHKSFPKSISWLSIGLPETFLPLIAQGRNAFIVDAGTTVCHGGLALEEVVVPYVRVTRKPT